jgi:hypothetical protein
MPRYYFDLKAESVLHDRDGEVHVDDSGAMAHADRIASELIGEYEGSVSVRNEEGREIGEVGIGLLETCRSLAICNPRPVHHARTPSQRSTLLKSRSCG